MDSFSLFFFLPGFTLVCSYLPPVLEICISSLLSLHAARFFTGVRNFHLFLHPGKRQRIGARTSTQRCNGKLGSTGVSTISEHPGWDLMEPEPEDNGTVGPHGVGARGQWDTRSRR
uniref:Uncharacterized protein n=1 Tax=Nelumbo nucifera TaxID=4432 RepID=A0A822YA73_NELNU|nr:TPA_asm: hypothetical protein HUJ06_030680 [Nelumbo nucifera]